MGKDDWLVAGSVLLGVIGLLALADSLKPKCPVCASEVVRGASICGKCGISIRWQ